MNNELSDAEYREVLTCIQGINRCRDLETFPKAVMGELSKLVPCDIVGYNEVNMARQRLLVVFEPPQQGRETLLQKFPSYLHDHPVIDYMNQTGDGQALKISDFLTVGEFHQRDIYQDFFRHFRVEDQISIAVRIDSGFVIGIAFNRSERSFTEKDRLRLNLVRPHLIQAYLYAAERAGHEEHKKDLQTALREGGLGVIAINPHGAVVHATPGVFDCLARHVPIPNVTPPQLPQSLLPWAVRNGNGASDQPDSLFFIGTEAKLTLRRVPGKERTILLLSEKIIAAPSAELDRYQLTAREREVLAWIAEGKSNVEIATILKLTAGTVKLHVVHVLAKLGVENRTAAALLAHRAGL